jgi:hypothetical protein
MENTESPAFDIRPDTLLRACRLRLSDWLPKASPSCESQPRLLPVCGADTSLRDLLRHMAVHELLHIILELQRYPLAQLDKSKLRRSTAYDELFEDLCVDVTNMFLHPEIYRSTNEV